MMKKGFTLAEVLITLAIIGVVAAVTIPTMTKDSWKEQAETSLKKIHSTWSNALELAELEHGDLTNASVQGSLNNAVYTLESMDDFYNYFSYKEGNAKKPFLNLIKCPEGEKKCKVPAHKSLGGVGEPNYGNFSFSGYWSFYTQDGIYYKVYTGDSNNQSTGANKGINVLILADINGQKGPNIVGIDTFYFVMCIGSSCNSNGGVYYCGTVAPGFYPAGKGCGTNYYSCSRTNTNGGSGAYCANKIMSESWQINY